MTTLPFELPDLAHARGGDRDAYARLVRATAGAVQAVAFSLLKDAALSQDVSQEVFCAAWTELPALRNPLSFLPWLRQMTRHRAGQLLRGSWRGADGETGLLHIADPSRSAETQLLEREDAKLLGDALESLPDDAREVVILFYQEQCSTAHVAELLGLREPTVRKRLSRARALLREGMERRLGELLPRLKPDARFSSAVLAALPSGSSALSTAALGVTALKASSLLALLTGASVAAASALVGTLGRILPAYRHSRDEDERRALRRYVAATTAGALVAAAMAMAALSLFPHRRVPVLAVWALWMGGLYLAKFHWLASILAASEAAERQRDASAARLQRRKRALRRVTFVISGGLLGVLICQIAQL